MTTPLTIEPKTRGLHQGHRNRINHEALLTGFACLAALSIALSGLMGQASPLETAPAVSWSVCALAILCALWLIHDRLDEGLVAGPLTGRSPSVVLDDVADVVLTVNCDLTVQRVRGTALPANLVLELLNPKDISGARCALSRCIAGEPSRFTARLRYPDDRVVDFRAVPVTVAEGAVSLRLFGWDITSWRRREDDLIRRQMELEQVNRQLMVDVNTDALTGLANRRHLLAAGSRILKEAIEERHTVSCVYLDLDHFKSINDTLGHDAGDKVLAEFAEVLKAHVRQDDVVARIGGEEFVLLLPRVPPHRAAEVARRIRRVVSSYHFSALPTGDHITVSIGVAIYDHDGLQDMQALLAAADRAAYDSKNRGRNRVSLESDLADRSGSGMVHSREHRPTTHRLRFPGLRPAPDGASSPGCSGAPEALRPGGPSDAGEPEDEAPSRIRPRRIGGRLRVRDLVDLGNEV